MTMDRSLLSRSRDRGDNYGKTLATIAFAHFYLDTHPNRRLTIFEEEGCVGGVWNELAD